MRYKVVLCLLLSVGISGCGGQNQRGKEQVLRKGLYDMRLAIDKYDRANKHLPNSLDELVAAGFLREVPSDPITGSKNTWVPQLNGSLYLNGKSTTLPGIIDVKSGARGTDKDGKPYSEY